jgi:prolyl oligopeptidase
VIEYPKTRREEHNTQVGGKSFPDPFQWLEGSSAEVIQWQRAQSSLAVQHVREWAHFDTVREFVRRFEIPPRVTLPSFAAGTWFAIETSRETGRPIVTTAADLSGEGRIIFSPSESDPDSHSTISWISPSPDGRILALGLCSDGSETNRIRLIDVATGARLPQEPPQVLMDNWTGGAHWLPDSSGFLFSALTGQPTDFCQLVYLHKRDSTPNTSRLQIPWISEKNYRAAVVSRDGRYAIATERLVDPIPVGIAKIGNGNLEWRPFVTLASGMVAGHVVGDHFIAVTDIRAPRGRLVKISLSEGNPNNPERWIELVSESAAVLRTVTPVGELLYLSELHDTYSRVRIVNLRGQEVGEVPLPAPGAISELPAQIMNVCRSGHPEIFLFGHSTITESPGIYSHKFGDSKVVTVKRSESRFQGATVEKHVATASDGAEIRYRLVRQARLNDGTPKPTLIYAYGGYSAPLLPQYAGGMLAIVAAGGNLVLAHIRGGGEFGREWWEAGRMRRKRNCFTDLYAVAQHLFAAGRCTSQTLGLTGVSNGGMLAGFAVVDRPDLWKVVVPRVPILDLIGACQDGYGRMCIKMDYADISHESEVDRLSKFSPYNLVREEVQYPAVLLQAGATDLRCPPWHARKMAARLQEANRSQSPILLHVWGQAGHGWATSKNVAQEQSAEWIAFVLQHLNVRLPHGLMN